MHARVATVRRLDERIRRHKPAYGGVIDPAVHVDQVEMVELFVAREPVASGIADRGQIRRTRVAGPTATVAPPPVRFSIHHSDRGSYDAADYRELLTLHGLRGSMSHRANPYDNARAESCMKTLKYEEIYTRDFTPFQDVVAQLPRFVDQIYNAERLHGALGYFSPMEFETIHARQAAQISDLPCPI